MNQILREVASAVLFSLPCLVVLVLVVLVFVTGFAAIVGRIL